MSPTLEAKGENPCSESCDSVPSSNRGPGARRGAGREAAVSSGHTRAQTGKDNSQQETGHLRTHQGMAYPTQLDGARTRGGASLEHPGAPHPCSTPTPPFLLGARPAPRGAAGAEKEAADGAQTGPRPCRAEPNTH